MGSFPLPTLAPTISASGISAPAYSAIYNSLIASLKAIFGSDIYIPPDSQDGQLLAVIALAQSDTDQAIITAVNGFSPSFAQGLILSAIVKINGLQRQIPSNSTVAVNIVGVAGTQINAGIIQDNNLNLWSLPAIVIIQNAGTILVTATAQQQGAILAPLSSTTWTIYTPTLGWQSVTSNADAAPGAAVETDAALRQRQAISTSLPAQTTLSAIQAAIANIAGVTRSTVYENQTASTDGNGVPSHTISAIVLGGNLTTIAQVIESKKSPGTGTFGSTSIIVTDPEGVPITINFYQLALQQIYVSITVNHLSNYVSTTGAAIVSALVSFITSLGIGQAVRYNWLLAVAQMIGSPLGETFVVTALTIGTAPSPSGTSDITIPFNQAATSATANVVLTVS